VRGKPYRTWISGSLAVVGLMTAVATMGQNLRTEARVYSVGEVKAGLVRRPTAWAGRVVLARGIVVTIHHNLFGAGLALASVGPSQTTVLVPDLPTLPHNQTALLSYILNARTGAVLLLRPQPADPVVTALQRVPIMGKLFPRQRRMTNDAPAVYRLQILAPQQSCLRDQCADAVLLDATP